jgi:hypothetical protein
MPIYLTGVEGHDLFNRHEPQIFRTVYFITCREKEAKKDASEAHSVGPPEPELHKSENWNSVKLHGCLLSNETDRKLLNI